MNRITTTVIKGADAEEARAVLKIFMPQHMALVQSDPGAFYFAVRDGLRLAAAVIVRPMSVAGTPTGSACLLGPGHSLPHYRGRRLLLEHQPQFFEALRDEGIAIGFLESPLCSWHRSTGAEIIVYAQRVSGPPEGMFPLAAMGQEYDTSYAPLCSDVNKIRTSMGEYRGFTISEMPKSLDAGDFQLMVSGGAHGDAVCTVMREAGSVAKIEHLAFTSLEAIRQLLSVIAGMTHATSVSVAVPIDYPLEIMTRRPELATVRTEADKLARIIDLRGTRFSQKAFCHTTAIEIPIFVQDELAPWNQRVWSVRRDCNGVSFHPSKEQSLANVHIRDLVTIISGRYSAEQIAFRLGFSKEDLSIATKLVGALRPEVPAYTSDEW